MTKDENKEILMSCKREFIIKLITSIMLVTLLLIIPILYSYGIDYINNSLFKKAYLSFIILGVISLIYRYVEIINQKSYYTLFSKLYKKYMNKGLEKTCNNSLYSLSRFSLSEYSNIMSEDFELLSDYYSTLIIRIVEILQFIYIIIYFFFINEIVGYITLFLSIIVIFFLLYSNKYIVMTNEIRKEKNDIRISLFQEIFLSIKEIKGYNIFKNLRDSVDKDINSYINYNNKLNIDKYNLRQMALLLVDIFKVVCLIYSVYLIFNGYMTIGVLTIIYSYYGKLSELFASIILLNENNSNVKVARKRIYKLFQYAQDKISIKDDYNDISGRIIFKDVIYGNIKNPALNYVSFSIKEKSLNIIFGDKASTRGVFYLLLKYNRKHKGDIFIDDVEIENYNKDNISNIVGIMMDTPIFFNKSIKDNLLLFDNNFENIVSICKYLEINEKILSMPDAYGTVLYNNGINIDEDLRYMLSFVKIFLKKSKIILLEDFWEHLSRRYQKLIKEVIYEIKDEHTIIMISRDKKLIKDSDVDQVILFSNGRLVDRGNHRDLYKSNKEYKNIFNKM